MNWDCPKEIPQAIQRQLFPEMNPEESRIVQILRKYPEGIQVNSLVVESNIAITSMTGILFELELKGVVKSLAGGMYRLV